MGRLHALFRAPAAGDRIAVFAERDCIPGAGSRVRQDVALDIPLVLILSSVELSVRPFSSHLPTNIHRFTGALQQAGI
jgi:hypothetical protein